MMESTPLGMLITGAGSGVGRGLAQYLAPKGHRLFLTDLRIESLEETLRLIEADRSAPFDPCARRHLLATGAGISFNPSATHGSTF